MYHSTHDPCFELVYSGDISIDRVGGHFFTVLILLGVMSMAALSRAPTL
jgi:hypothetical protein